MDRHVQRSRLSGARDQFMEGGSGYRRAPLGKGDIGGFRSVAQHFEKDAQFRQLVEDMRAQWAELDRRIEAFNDGLAASAKEDEAAWRQFQASA